MRVSELQADVCPVKVGNGVLARTPRVPCYGSLYHPKRQSAGRHGKGTQSKTEKEHRKSAQAPWLLFSNVEGVKPVQIMTLYSRRMQIEQNFRDEKSPRFGYGLRFNRSQGKGRLEVLSVVVAMASLVMWLTGYVAEKKQLNRHYQANTVKDRRILSYLRLAWEVVRNRPGIVKRMNIFNILKMLGKEYSIMVMGC